MSRGIPGWVYLIHIDEPVGSGAQHYMGWSSNVPKREEAHKNGKGARLLKVARRRGVPFRVVRTWEGLTRSDEARMKRRGNLAGHCPLCRDAWLAKRNKVQSARRARDGRADRPRKNPRGPKT